LNRHCTTESLARERGSNDDVDWQVYLAITTCEGSEKLKAFSSKVRLKE
jgi:hypothetical protein